jgi:signal transduction histidine kinase/CHASE3 domain sensor protein/ActR/RegA family two-component response regulator
MRIPVSLRLQSAAALVVAVVVITAVFLALRADGESVARETSAVTQLADFDHHNLQLFDALLNQETGVHGYALTGNPVFLDPYQLGRKQFLEAEKAITGKTPEGAVNLVADERKAAADWQQWAQTRIDLVSANGSGGLPADAEGKRLVDAFRSKWTALNQHDARLEQAANASLAGQLSRQQSTRSIGWFAVMAALAALATVIFFRILRPLMRQSQAALELDGETLIEIPGRGRRDEIGQLAGTLDALQATLRERVSLARAMERVGGRAELSDVVELGARFFAEQLDAEEVVLTLFDGSRRYVAGTHAGLLDPGRTINQATPADQALAGRRTVISSVDEMPPGEIKDIVLAKDYGPLLTLPLLTGGETVGVVTALRAAGRPQFGQDEIQRAEILAPVISAATKVARLVSEVREANQVKSRFLANMSHELRTPLNAILGFSQVLAAGDFGDLNERQLRYVGHIGTSGGRLLDLINDILDLSKVEAGLLEMRMQELDLAELMLACRSEIDRIAATKGLDLAYDLAPGIRVWAEPRRLQQVVVNLLTNAVKFTPAGGQVMLTTAAVDGRARIAVLDSGIGIAPGEQDRIFDEFVQADDDSAREQKGTGLGLSLSRKLTELMGGTLTMSSELGVGSEFTVELELSNHTPDAGGGPLVLVVEDEGASTELLEVILSEADYRVTAVSNVAQASEAIRKERPEAILLDISLPGPDGWTFLKELKGDPSTREVPVVAVTVLDEAPPAHRQQLAGFITKPVQRDALLRLLAKLTSRGITRPGQLVRG